MLSSQYIVFLFDILQQLCTYSFFKIKYICSKFDTLNYWFRYSDVMVGVVIDFLLVKMNFKVLFFLFSIVLTELINGHL